MNNNAININGKDNIVAKDINNSQITIYKYLIDNQVREIPNLLNSIPIIDTNKYINRNEELYKVYQKLVNNRALCIYGLGGIGKTTFAKLFIKLFANEFKHLVWFYNIDNNLKQLIVRDNRLLDSLNLKFDDKTLFEHKFQIIVNRLSQLEGKNICIIDNVNLSLFKNNFLDDFNLSDNWLLFFTSREQINLNTLSMYELKTLSLANAKKLFYSFYGRESTETSDIILTDIINLVGFHTLTIELLAKTAQANRNLSISKLKALLEKEGLKFPKNSIVQMEYDKEIDTNVLKCIEIAFDHISELEETDRIFLIQYSILPSIYITYLELIELFQIPEEDEFQFNNTLNTLCFKGFLSESTDGFKCHQVIQDFLRIKYKPNVCTCRSIIKSIEKLTQYNPYENPLEKLKYLKYIDNIYLYIDCDDLTLASIYHNINDILDSSGDFNKSITYGLRALEIRERLLGKIHPDTGYSYNNVAVTYNNLNNYEKSIEFQLTSIAIREDTLNSEHPDLAQSYNNLAHLYLQKKEFETALNHYNKALSIWSKSYPDSKHPDIIMVLNNIATCYLKQNNIDFAEKFYNKVCNLLNLCYKYEHPDKAMILNNIGYFFYCKKDLNKALYYYNQSLSMFELLYNENHLILQQSLINLGELYSSTADYQKAIEYYNKIATIIESNYGQNSQHLIEILLTLSVLHKRNNSSSTGDLLINRISEIFQTNKNIDLSLLNQINSVYNNFV